MHNTKITRLRIGGESLAVVALLLCVSPPQAIPTWQVGDVPPYGNTDWKTNATAKSFLTANDDYEL